MTRDTFTKCLHSVRHATQRRGSSHVRIFERNPEKVSRKQIKWCAEEAESPVAAIDPLRQRQTLRRPSYIESESPRKDAMSSRTTVCQCLQVRPSKSRLSSGKKLTSHRRQSRSRKSFITQKCFSGTNYPRLLECTERASSHGVPLHTLAAFLSSANHKHYSKCSLVLTEVEAKRMLRDTSLNTQGPGGLGTCPVHDFSGISPKQAFPNIFPPTIGGLGPNDRHPRTGARGDLFLVNTGANRTGTSIYKPARLFATVFPSTSTLPFRIIQKGAPSRSHCGLSPGLSVPCGFSPFSCGFSNLPFPEINRMWSFRVLNLRSVRRKTNEDQN